MIAGIIMASGFSRRAKAADKLLIELEGIPVVERVIRSVTASKLDFSVLVYRDDKVSGIGRKYNIDVAYNPQAEKGQSEAIKAGILSLKNSYNGYMFFVGDQPLLTAEIIDRLINEFCKDMSKIVIPKYNGKIGNPVIFPEQYKESLLSLNGDVGGRQIINSALEHVSYIDIDSAIAGLDIDTLEDYDAVRTLGCMNHFK